MRLLGFMELHKVCDALHNALASLFQASSGLLHALGHIS